MNMTSELLIELAVKEYETLRAEMVGTVERQYSLTNWSVSTVAVFIAAIVAGWGTLKSIPGIISVILLLIIPATMTVYVVSWSHIISKVNQLGERLFEIEENLASAVDPVLIRQTYRIPSSEDVRPYKYTLGWEHKLWNNGVNLRVQATIRIVRIALSAIYLLFIILNALLMVNLQQFSSVIIWSTSLTAGAFWATIWFLVFQYLRRRTSE